MTWILLSLLAPFLWAASNIFDKYALEKVSRGIYDFLFFGSIGAALVFVLTYLVFGATFVFPFSLYALLSGLLLNYSYLFYSYALEKEDASHVVPIYVSYAVFVLLFNVFLFGETLTTLQLIAFAIIFSGGFVLSIESLDLSSLRWREGAKYMLPAVIILAASITFFNQAIEGMDFVSAFVLDMGGFALAGLSFLLITRWRQEIFAGLRSASIRKFSLFFFNDTIDLAGHLAYKYALVLAPAASLVAAINGIQPFYVLLLGVFLTTFLPHIIKEDVSVKALLQKIAGAIIIGLGIAMLQLL